jgi:Probable zinc-ribbon domain
MSTNNDRELTCVDCGQQFTWTAEDQAFFKEKGYEPPKRCKPCRQAKKEQRGAQGRR